MVSDLEDSIPEVPSVLSELVNDVGYITSYTETDPTVPAWAKAASKPTYTAAEVGALPDTTVITDEKLKTELLNTNNMQYVILGDATTTATTKVYSETLKFQQSANRALLTIGKQNSNNGTLQIWKGDYITYLEPNTSSSNHTVYLPSQAGTLALTSDIDNSKLKTTASENNAEYNLLGTEINDNNTSAISIYKQNLLSFAKTTDLSRLTIGSTATPGVVRIYTSTNGASGFTDLKSAASGTTERTITLPDASGTVALTTDIPSVPSWALNSTKPSYTFSELTSHPTTLNDYGITNAYTKTEVDGLVSGVLHYKGTKATTSALPSSGNVTGDVWHITADGSEWAWDGSAWQELGTATDLSGYLQTGDIAAWAKAANKPTYTASEVGALPSSTTYVSSFNGNSGAITYTAPVTSINEQTGAVTITAASISAAASDHTHGSITNAGAITANTAIASSDRLVFADNSDSGKLKRSTITFGSSTAQYLANNGTWQNVPAAVSVSNTLSSGTLIATINGTNIYAPAYTDADGVSY